MSKEIALSCLVPQQERFFREMAKSLFPLFCDFLSVFDVLRRINFAKSFLWLDLKWFAQLRFISHQRIHQDHELHRVITPVFPFIPPPPLYLEVKKVKAYIIRNANRQILRGRGRKLVFLRCFYIFFPTFFLLTHYIKLDEPKMTFVFCS